MIELWEHQAKAKSLTYRAFNAGKKRVMIMSPTGCHALGTEILMKNGTFKCVEKITIGDVLMGVDSRPRRVIDLHQGFEEMVKIKPKRGSDFIVNKNHILSLVRTNDGTKKQGLVDNISVSDYIKTSKTYKHVHKLRYASALNFSEKTFLIPPYITGLLLGDGCITHHPNFSNPDKEIITALSKWCEKNEATVKTSDNLNYRMTSRRGSPNKILNLLREFGIFGLKAGEKHIPGSLHISSVSQRLDLIAGLLDTDGHYDGYCYDWVTKSKQLAEQMHFMVRSVGLYSKINKCKKSCGGFTGTYYRMCISGNLEIIPCKVKRKKAKTRRQKKNHLRTGFSFETLSTGKYYGFEVDGDNLYITSDFMVHHNSGKTVYAGSVIQDALKKGKKSIFICDMLTLIDQTVEEFQHLFGFDVGVIQGSGSAAHPMMDFGKPVQVASIQTIDAMLKRESRAGNVGEWANYQRDKLIIIDEAHTHYKAHDQVITHADQVIGLSATPWRRGLGKIYEELIIPTTTKKLIASGKLSQYEALSVPKVDLKGVSIGANGDYSPGQVSERFGKELVADVVSTWRKHANNKKTILFASSIADSKRFRDEFIAAGVKAVHVDGYLDREECHAEVEKFRLGGYTVICSVFKLAKGFNVKNIECVIDCAPTKSLMRHIQKLGRGLRCATGKLYLIILDHAGNLSRLGLPDGDFPATLDNGDPANKNPDRKKKDAPLPKDCQKCKKIKPAGAHKCPHCGFAPEKLSTTVVVAGELVKITSKNANKVLDWPAKIEFIGGLKHIQAENHYAPGWVAHQYREFCGVWPNDRRLKEALAVAPNKLVKNQITAQNIKRRYRRDSKRDMAKSKEIKQGAAGVS